MKKAILIFIVILVLLTGCNPMIPIDPIFPLNPELPIEPELYRIEITPRYTEIQAGSSVQLSVTGYSEKNEVVNLDEADIFWSKGCPSGSLEPLMGYTTTFTSIRTSSGIMIIYCDYEDLSDKARINIIGRR